MFQKTRLKLTAWYLFIIMCISISFSVVIYRVLSNEVERFTRIQRSRIERRLREGEFFPPSVQFRNSVPIMDPELLEEVKRRLVLRLLIVNGGILVISGGLGYVLAGRTLQPIQVMLDEQNRFVTDSSHELRTPLTSLKSALEVHLRDEDLTLKDAKIVIAESIDEVNKLQSLSDKLLQLAQYQKPNGYVQFEKLSLFEIVKEAAHKMEPLAKQKNIVIKNTILHNEISGNKKGLSDLLTILLDNAIKYSTEGKVIWIDTKKANNSLIISVRDEGIGIRKKDIVHIFDRFYRTDIARSKKDTGGYGIGLSIAKEIVDTHHGTICVKSKFHKGSTFLVRLPIHHSGYIAKPPFFS